MVILLSKDKEEKMTDIKNIRMICKSLVYKFLKGQCGIPGGGYNLSNCLIISELPPPPKKNCLIIKQLSLFCGQIHIPKTQGMPLLVLYFPPPMWIWFPISNGRFVRANIT
jgi:hypothetical protein